MIDETPSKDRIAVVEDGGLTGCDRTLRLIKKDGRPSLGKRR